MNVAALSQQFKVSGVTFDESNGLVRVNVTTKAATATIYLQGAHLTAWQPMDFEPVIFLSHKSKLVPGEPIRGGIPIAFPWFAGDRKKDRIDGHPGPFHGFARIQDWTLTNVMDGTPGNIGLRFTLGPTAMSRAMCYSDFGLPLDFLIGQQLRLVMTVKTTGKEAMSYEEAFHTYYQVADIHEVSVDGLESTAFIDKADGMKTKPSEHQPIRFTKKVDRMYSNTRAELTIHDVAGRRKIMVRKEGSNTTVVWNPFGPLPDLGEWEWHSLCAMETANVGDDAITLAPGESSVMAQLVTLMKI